MRREKKPAHDRDSEIHSRLCSQVSEFIFCKVPKKNSAVSDVFLERRQIKRGNWRERERERKIAARFRAAIRSHSNQDLYANEGKHNTTTVLEELLFSTRARITANEKGSPC